MCFFEKKNQPSNTEFCNLMHRQSNQCISPTPDYHEGLIGTLPISNAIDLRVEDGGKRQSHYRNPDFGTPTKPLGISPAILCYNTTTTSSRSKASYQKFLRPWRE